MKTLSCAALGVAECPFVAQAETAEQVMAMMSEHGATAHAEKMAEMAQTMNAEQMSAMMMSKMEDSVA